MEIVFTAVAWVLLSAVSIGGFAGGIYLLVSPGDALTVRYQNDMLRRTFLPLKDEHFSNMREVLFFFRLTGGALLLSSLFLAGWIFRAMAASGAS